MVTIPLVLVATLLYQNEPGTLQILAAYRQEIRWFSAFCKNLNRLFFLCLLCAFVPLCEALKDARKKE
jgi:hypothetical protein